MDISLIIKVAGVGLLVAVAYVVLSKTGRDEMAMLVSLCGIITVLLLIVDKFAELFTAIKTAFGI